MPLQYKYDILSALTEKGYYPTRLRKEKILSESTIQKLRKGEGVSWSSLEVICGLLECQLGDIVEYQEES